MQSHRQLILQRASSNIQRRRITAIAAPAAGWTLQHQHQHQQQHQQYQHQKRHRQYSYRFHTILSTGKNVNKRFYSRPSVNLLSSSSSSGGPTGSDYHQSFQQQIQELEDERNALFGTSTNEGGNDNSAKVSNTKNNDSDNNGNSNAFFEEQLKELEQERIQLFGNTSDAGDTSSSTVYDHNDGGIEGDEMKKTIDEMNQEREELYNFTTEEKMAWGNVTAATSNSNNTNSDNNNNNNNNGDVKESFIQHAYSPEFMDAVNKAREAKALYEDKMKEESSIKVNEMIQELKNNYDGPEDSNTQSRSSNVSETSHQGSTIGEDENNPIFTHLDKAGEEVSMVDVGDKVVSKRIAVARSSVLFPPEVMEAFGLFSDSGNNTNVNTSEVIGPKGPIFATARLAGIMGAKRTSDLIPLCHPLPLSKVHVDIRLEGNRAVIDCECRVTSKTGVEMEALAGASIAALTIYDMVKAVSHNVKIESTFLVKKSGGKRDVSI